MDTKNTNEVIVDISPITCGISCLWGDEYDREVIIPEEPSQTMISIGSFFDRKFKWEEIQVKNYIPVSLLKDLAEVVVDSSVDYDLNGNGQVNHNQLAVLIPVYYCKALFLNVAWHTDDFVNYDALMASRLIERMGVDKQFELFATMCNNHAKTRDDENTLQNKVLDYLNDNENEMNKFFSTASSIIEKVDVKELGKMVTPSLLKMVDFLCANPILKKVIMHENKE